MNKKTVFPVFLLVAMVAVSIVILYPRRNSNLALDDFAKCLSDKGVLMYGADWCPHCQNEKRAFGDSFGFINYIECPADPDRCLAAGIKGYPTWVFLDGRRLEGEQGLENLSKESGCALRSTSGGAGLQSR